jgi:hypothetical protein
VIECLPSKHEALNSNPMLSKIFRKIGKLMAVGDEHK